MAKSYFHKAIILSGAVAIAVFFQNCSDGEGRIRALEAQSQTSVEANQSYKIQVDNTDTLIFNNLPLENSAFAIDLQTGEIANLDKSSGQKFCLSQGELSELQAILSTASVCIPPERDASDGRLCAQVMREPYAELLSGNGSFRLGEASDSCSQALDLCDGQGDLLKGFIAHIKSNLSSRICD